MPNYVEIAPTAAEIWRFSSIAALLFRVKPRHVKKFRFFENVGLQTSEKVSWEKRTEASKFTKMGTWGG